MNFFAIIRGTAFQISHQQPIHAYQNAKHGGKKTNYKMSEAEQGTTEHGALRPLAPLTPPKSHRLNMHSHFRGRNESITTLNNSGLHPRRQANVDHTSTSERLTAQARPLCSKVLREKTARCVNVGSHSQLTQRGS